MKQEWSVYIYKALSPDWKEDLNKINVDHYALKKLSQKLSHYVFYIKDVSSIAANIIKQEALSKGGEAVVSRQILTNLDTKTDILLSLTGRQLDAFCLNLKEQPFRLKQLANELRSCHRNYNSNLPKINISDKILDFNNNVYVMGILNVTPDSFYDGGKFNTEENALKHAKEMILAGADIIDVGGESTRPGSKSVSAEEELGRVIPLIRKIRKVYPEILVSIDTTKSIVAEKAISAGANIINDISAGLFDKEMFRIVEQYRVPYVLMHTLDRPDKMQTNINYNDLLADIYSGLKDRIQAACNAGIDEKLLIIDPGFGFGKTVNHNLVLLNNLSIFKSLGLPILVGTSNKSFIKKSIEQSVNGCAMGTAATVSISVLNGANIIRVHDVKKMQEIVKMSYNVCRSQSK